MSVRHVAIDREELDRCRELVRYVPGYCGYRLKELRRREDKRLRDEVARMLLNGAARLETVEKEAYLSGGRGAAAPLAESRKRLARLSERISSASCRSGFFDKEDVSSASLKELMEADREVLRLADAIVKCVSKLEQNDIPDDEREFRSKYLADSVERLSLAYDARDGVLSSCA